MLNIKTTEDTENNNYYHFHPQQQLAIMSANGGNRPSNGATDAANGYFINTAAAGPALADDTILNTTTIPPQILQQQQQQPNEPENQLTQYLQDPNYMALTKPGSSSSSKGKKHHTKSKPAFVLKLWTMVNDPNNHDLINWYHDGNSFLVTNRELFVQKILPKYFKHSNFASFVRQLNMYGWHKVQDASSGSLHSDEKWQFINPNFQKGRPDLLDKIVRNKPNDEHNNSTQGGGAGNNQSNDGNGTNGQFDVSLLINELNTLKANQMKITQELSRVRSDNESLWQELFQTREKNLVQNEKIEKILHFLASVYGNRVQALEDHMNFNNHNQFLSNQPNYDHYQQHGSQQQNQQSQQPSPQVQTPHSVNNNNNNNNNVSSPGYQQKPRLMIKQTRHVSNPSNASTPLSNITTDDSPIQEIIRTPNFQNYVSTPQYQQPPTPQQYNNNQQYPPPQGYGQYLPSDDFQQIPPSMQPPAIPPQQQQFQPPQQAQFMAPQPGPPLPPQQQQQYPQRPAVMTHQPSFEDLSKTIEQQGQSINDIINRIQQNQPPHQNQQNTGNSSTSNSDSQPQTFDLDEFLNQDLIQDDNNTGYVETPKIGTIREIFDDDQLSKKHADDDDGGDDEDGEIEEIINPSKKRRAN